MLQQKQKRFIYTFILYTIMVIIHLTYRAAFESNTEEIRIDAFEMVLSILGIAIVMVYNREITKIDLLFTSSSYMWTSAICAFSPMLLFNALASWPGAISKNMPSVLLVVLVLVNIILGAAFEELLGRGMITAAVAEITSSRTMVVVISALIFSLSHFTNLLTNSFSAVLPDVLLGFMVGIVYSEIYIATGNLFIPITVHVLENACVEMPALFGTGATPIPDTILTILFVIGMFALVLLVIRLHQVESPCFRKIRLR